MITMKAVSPVYIGTGVEYSPIEFVLRRDKGGNDWLWRIDQSRFLSSLSESKRDQFIVEVEEEDFDLNRFAQGLDLFPLRRYIARDLSGTGRIPAVRECIKTADRAYIPGSSLKGAIRTALLWSVARDDNRFVRSIQAEAGDRINRKWIGKRYVESVFQCGGRGYDPKYDLLKFLVVSDFMPNATNNIRLDRVRTLSLTRTGTLAPKTFEPLVEAVIGSFHGSIEVSSQIAAAACNREYPSLRQKLALIGMKDPDETESVIPYLKAVMRNFNRWCFERERRLIDRSGNAAIVKEMNRIGGLLDGRDLIRVGFGVGTTYQTLFGLVEEKDPDLAAHIASQIGRYRRTVGPDGRLDPPYPKTVEQTATGHSLGWLEW